MSLLNKQCVFTPTRKNTLVRDTLRPDTINKKLYWFKIMIAFAMQ